MKCSHPANSFQRSILKFATFFAVMLILALYICSIQKLVHVMAALAQLELHFVSLLYSSDNEVVRTIDSGYDGR